MDTSTDFSQIYLTHRVEGGRKCFLTKLACQPKTRYKKMKLWCYSVVWMPPSPTPFNPSSPPPTPYLPPVSSTPFTHAFIGVNAVTCNVNSPRVCSPLCPDHLWQMRVLCVQYTVPLSSCFHLPLSSERDGWAGGGVKDGQSGAVCPDMTNPEGDASLSLGCCVKWQTGRCSVTSLCQCLDQLWWWHCQPNTSPTNPHPGPPPP